MASAGTFVLHEDESPTRNGGPLPFEVEQPIRAEVIPQTRRQQKQRRQTPDAFIGEDKVLDVVGQQPRPYLP